MKVYIAGKITGNPEYKKDFALAEMVLKEQGHTVLNPAILPDGFEQFEYLTICFSMIKVCEAVFFLSNWKESAGACAEYEFAMNNKKQIIMEEM